MFDEMVNVLVKYAFRQHYTRVPQNEMPINGKRVRAILILTILLRLWFKRGPCKSCKEMECPFSQLCKKN